MLKFQDGSINNKYMYHFHIGILVIKKKKKEKHLTSTLLVIFNTRAVTVSR